jgi:monothiol glutaredoxin
MERDVFAEIREEISRNKVIIYMKGTPDFPMCGFSAAAVECLRAHGYPFAHVDVLEDPEKREAIKEFSNWPTIPQIYINGQFIGGCDIVRELHASGELRKLLEQAFSSSGENATAR